VASEWHEREEESEIEAERQTERERQGESDEPSLISHDLACCPPMIPESER
jgi:hypothetical protein